MANKQNTPHFDAAAIQAKRKKVKGVKTSSRDRAISSRGLESLARDAFAPSHSPKHPRTEGGTTTGEIGSSIASIPDTSSIPNLALPLNGSFAHPLPSPSLVSFHISNPLLKDASRFITEFDGDAGTAVTSIYDRRFLNEVFIDHNLSLPSNKEKHEKIGLLGLLRVQQAFALRSASIFRHIEKQTRAIANRLAIF